MRLEAKVKVLEEENELLRTSAESVAIKTKDQTLAAMNTELSELKQKLAAGTKVVDTMEGKIVKVETVSVTFVLSRCSLTNRWVRFVGT